MALLSVDGVSCVDGVDGAGGVDGESDGILTTEDGVGDSISIEDVVKFRGEVGRTSETNVSVPDVFSTFFESTSRNSFSFSPTDEATDSSTADTVPAVISQAAPALSMAEEEAEEEEEKWSVCRGAVEGTGAKARVKKSELGSAEDERDALRSPTPIEDEVGISASRSNEGSPLNATEDGSGGGEGRGGGEGEDADEDNDGARGIGEKKGGVAMEGGVAVAGVFCGGGKGGGVMVGVVGVSRLVEGRGMGSAVVGGGRGGRSMGELIVMPMRGKNK